MLPDSTDIPLSRRYATACNLIKHLTAGRFALPFLRVAAFAPCCFRTAQGSRDSAVILPCGIVISAHTPRDYVQQKNIVKIAFFEKKGVDKRYIRVYNTTNIPNRWVKQKPPGIKNKRGGSAAHRKRRYLSWQTFIHPQISL